VLLIDDDRCIVHGTTLRLRAAGYQIAQAFDGPQGLVAALEQQPDLILSDVRMPGMDGLQVLRKLKEHSRTKDIPVVMLSASLVDQQEALDVGARYFLSKPCHKHDLLVAVSSAIGESLASEAK
jgi:CheY-like chemotaxis protein